jgi:transcriptional regulator with GAF, ATPase, and Fis domain
MRDKLMARAFVEFSDTLVGDYDVMEFLARLCERSVEVLEVSAAGAVLSDGDGGLGLAWASTDSAKLLETLQLQHEEGPCLDAYRDGTTVVVADLHKTEKQRWPQFTPLALAAGATAISAFPMRLRHQRVGALNVFSSDAGLLDSGAMDAGQALADIATIAILQARAISDASRVTSQLERALESRVAIEQAKGVLAERLGVDPGEAFTRLRRYAREHGLGLTALAHEVVDGTVTLDL